MVIVRDSNFLEAYEKRYGRPPFSTKSKVRFCEVGKFVKCLYVCKWEFR